LNSANLRRPSLLDGLGLFARSRQSEGRHPLLSLIQSNRPIGGTRPASFKPLMWYYKTGYVDSPHSIVFIFTRGDTQYKKPSFFKRISLFGGARRPPQLTAAEQLIQLSIRKRATAFVDARDDLETKIGRLSRRLNFLITESDLWRDKFVTFEQYAEKLSAEANQLRAKINKEQRETKRLSGLVTLTAAEKSKLQNR
jgi:nicotinamide N-methyltransferase